MYSARIGMYASSAVTLDVADMPQFSPLFKGTCPVFGSYSTIEHTAGKVTPETALCCGSGLCCTEAFCCGEILGCFVTPAPQGMAFSLMCVIYADSGAKVSRVVSAKISRMGVVNPLAEKLAEPTKACTIFPRYDQA